MDKSHRKVRRRTLIRVSKPLKKIDYIAVPVAVAPPVATDAMEIAIYIIKTIIITTLWYPAP